jgi:urease accessory protein UreE
MKDDIYWQVQNLAQEESVRIQNHRKTTIEGFYLWMEKTVKSIHRIKTDQFEEIAEKFN